MKVTIEIEQETPQSPPIVRVLADGEPVGMIQRLELELNSKRVLPQLMIRFPDLNKLNVGVVSGLNLNEVKNAIASFKKKLSTMPWIDLP